MRHQIRLIAIACFVALVSTNVYSDETIVLKSFDQKFVKAMPDGAMTADQPTIGNQEKFRLVRKDGGKVALQSFDGKFVKAVQGKVTASETSVGNQELFTIVPHNDGTVSLFTINKTYFKALPNGELSAGETKAGNQEKFMILVIQ